MEASWTSLRFWQSLSSGLASGAGALICHWLATWTPSNSLNHPGSPNGFFYTAQWMESIFSLCQADQRQYVTWQYNHNCQVRIRQQSAPLKLSTAAVIYLVTDTSSHSFTGYHSMRHKKSSRYLYHSLQDPLGRLLIGCTGDQFCKAALLWTKLLQHCRLALLMYADCLITEHLHIYTWEAKHSMQSYDA